jgi:hypothetical protein
MIDLWKDVATVITVPRVDRGVREYQWGGREALQLLAAVIRKSS